MMFVQELSTCFKIILFFYKLLQEDFDIFIIFVIFLVVSDDSFNWIFLLLLKVFGFSGEGVRFSVLQSRTVLDFYVVYAEVCSLSALSGIELSGTSVIFQVGIVCNYHKPRFVY